MIEHPPQHLLPWLTCRTYLTEQLFAKSGNTSLQVLQQIWEPANDWDRDTLLLSDEMVLHRDIIVSAWNQPCWFARTILPNTTYQAHPSLFERLNHEPLGNLIFHSQAIQRLSLDYKSIEPHAPEYTWIPNMLNKSQQALWLRSSTFQVDNSDLFYLIEILLPNLERYC